MKFKILYASLVAICAFCNATNLSAQSAGPTPQYIFLRTPGEAPTSSTLGTITFKGLNSKNEVADGAMIKSIVARSAQGAIIPASFEFLTGVDALKTRLHISENGWIGVNTNKPNALLNVNQFGVENQTTKLLEVRGGMISDQKSFLVSSESNLLSVNLQGDLLVREGNCSISDGNINVENGNLFIKGGKIAIGTGTDDLKGNHRLYVNGSIVTTEVKVEYYKNWPDYVFNPGYKIDLEDTENYINKNKHLPGIPSSEDIARNGLELGEMQKLLLEKIEELTLIVIEHKKKIDDLNKKLEQLKSKNE